MMVRMSAIPTNPELDRLLKEAADHVMTPAEIWDQRVSYVYGEMNMGGRSALREDVVKRITETYGPRPAQAGEDG